MWPSVRRGEDRNIFPNQEKADVMFNSALVYELSVLKLYAEPLLFQIEEGEPEYQEAKRLLKFLDYFVGVPIEDITKNSILREFVGGSCFDVGKAVLYGFGGSAIWGWTRKRVCGMIINCLMFRF